VKVHLMAPDADFDPAAPGATLPVAVQDMVQDLQLDVLLDAMGGGDPLLRSAARSALLAPLTSPDVVRHRQQVLADCLAHPDVARALYDVAGRALAAERSVWWVSKTRPEMMLDRAVRVLGLLVGAVDELRALVAAHGDELASPGMRAFVATVRRELDDEYMKELRDRLALLARSDGLLVGAGLADDGEVTHPVPRVPRRAGRLFPRVVLAKPAYSFTIPDRDEAGFRALGALRDRALWRVAHAADRAMEHVLGFFRALRGEVAFYLACVELHRRLTGLGMPLCFPEPLPVGADTFVADALYDPCLALRTGAGVVTNGVSADGVRLLVVTGANHGGKTTLLRAVGVAQLLTGAGAFVPAGALRAALVPAVLTHWAREEDSGLRHGKLDEELARMSAVVDELVPGALLLSNESFASTNEAEGSRIALTVVRALVGAGVRVAAVTHLYGLAGELYADGDPPGVFLRAARGEEGRRPYRIEPGAPLSTSFARDLYEREFGPAEGVAPG
jgi:hypothetical protein